MVFGSAGSREKHAGRERERNGGGGDECPRAPFLEYFQKRGDPGFPKFAIQISRSCFAGEVECEISAGDRAGGCNSRVLIPGVAVTGGENGNEDIGTAKCWKRGAIENGEEEEPQGSQVTEGREEGVPVAGIRVLHENVHHVQCSIGKCEHIRFDSRRLARGLVLGARFRALGNLGHKVIAPDLPAHGADTTPLTAKPYEMYVPRVCELLDGLKDRAILVGHSSGGMIITEAAAQRNERIRSLVYLSAFLLPPGQTPREAMLADNESILRSSLEIDRERGVSIVKAERARDVFYADCSPEDAEWAIGQLQPEPLVPPGPGASGAENGKPATRIPRFYIECLQDKALGPRTQKRMYAESPCDGVYSLPTGHSPFLSAPEILTQYLLEIDARGAGSSR